MQIAAFTISVLLSLPVPAYEPSLEGCLPPRKLAQHLNKVRHTWPALTREQLVSKWPAKLAQEFCETEGGKCLMLVSRDRIINGRAECTTAFVFHSSEAHQETLALHSVVVNHTATTHREALAVARVLAAAFAPPGGSGPAPASLESTETAPLAADFQWEEVAWIWAEDVRIYPLESHWRVYLTVSRMRK